MRLEDYFTFLSADDIRIKGAGVPLEQVLYGFLYGNDTPEAIAARFPTVRVEHVYAAITYYYHQQEMVEAYVARWVEREKAAAEERARAAGAVREVFVSCAVQAA